MRRSCSEIKSANPDLDSGMYWIDPDGQDVGDDPIEVHCDMSSGFYSLDTFRNVTRVCQMKTAKQMFITRYHQHFARQRRICGSG